MTTSNEPSWVTRAPLEQSELPDGGEKRIETAQRRMEAADDASPWAALLEARPLSAAWPAQPFVGLCTDNRHPSLAGRVKIRRETSNAPANSADAERWVPTLHGLSIRVGDRLLVQVVDGHAEPIVIGVIDGFFPRPEAPRQPGPSIVLERDELMSIQSPDGQALLEIVQDEAGPIVRLLGDATRLELPGKLSITAAELELKASKGAARIEATDEVQLRGETIQLN